MKSYENIDFEILGYIKEIASKMKNNRASVMVGAGFSKNAEPIIETEKEFLDWNALGDVFFNKIYGRNPNEKEKYLNVLKLAEEVESAFGRTVLNQLIKDSLPDEEYVPGELHEKLLSLAWKDVFTTNYDTLLERTHDKITDKNYTIVLNKEDLIYSTEPRIIKLHGSFPSTLPFVITEEDYRQYPKRSAIFVNTVQQTLIENVLCLIGFSGDDPNFLQWIGWIRDNLGKDVASKIYLIGVFDFSTAQINLLNSRNIVVLNMNKCRGVGKYDHKAGLKLFLNTLSDLSKDEDENKWPAEPYHHIMFEKDGIEEKVDKVIEDWKITRTQYPGWIILPSNKRKTLLRHTESCELALMHIARGILGSKASLEFLFEYSWRINKCLKPILKRELKAYEKVVFYFNPFPEEFTINEKEIKYQKGNQDWQKYSYIWIELLLDILRTYRENGQFSKYESIADKLNKIKTYLSKDQIARFNCENVKKLMFQMKVKEAKETIEYWQRDVSLPMWEIKRAGILMELGDVSQALKVISDELNYVRKSHTKEINYYKISLEAHLMVLASYAKQSLRIIDKEDTVKISKLYDPYSEIRLFEAMLKEQPEVKYEKENFDLNSITRTMIASENKSYIEAFQFIRYFDEVGIPFNSNHVVFSKNAALEAVRRINPYATLWSLILQVKINDHTISDKVWSRDIIANMTNDEVENACRFCMDAIKNNMELIEKSNRWTESNFQLGIAAVMPEILSRLCTRMSNDMKLQVLGILNEIYQSNTTVNFLNIKNLAKRLVTSMSEKMKIKHFDLLMNMYIYQPENDIEKIEFSDIFASFSYQNATKDKYKDIILNEHLTEILLQLLDKKRGRDVAISRLGYLYKFGLLSSEETELFQKKLWEDIDEYGLPRIPDFYSKNYILDLPSPENVDVKELIKKYILALDIAKQQRGIHIEGNNQPLLILELDFCTWSFDEPEGVRWNDNEIETILKKVFVAWDNDKKYLVSDDNDLFSEETKEVIIDKYKSLDNVISKVLFSCGSKIKSVKGLKKLIKELEEYGLPYVQLKIIVNDDVNAFNEIYNIMCGIDDNKIISACNTIHALSVLKLEDYKEPLENLIFKLSLNIRTRRLPGLISIIYLMHNLIYSNVLPENNIIIENILFGLDSLFYETILQNNYLKCSSNQCISLRAASNSLAYIMYKKFREHKEVCQRLVVWKNISEDLNEFSEVRNKWLDL